MAVAFKIIKKKPTHRGRGKPRDERGRFRPGFSGNPRGRPRKQVELPKFLSEQLADAMAEKIAMPNADGSVAVVSAYEGAARQLVRSMATAKPKELLAILEAMEKLMVFHVMRQKAEPPEPLVTDRDLELLAALKKHLSDAELDAMVGRAASPPKRKRARPGPGGPPQG